MKKVALTTVALAIFNTCSADPVATNAALSWAMMSNQSGVGKEINLLQARQNGLNTLITIGGFAAGNLIDQGLNQAGQFNAVPLEDKSLFTESQGSNSDSATQLAVSHANLAITAALGSWVTTYIQTGASSLGQGNADTLSVQDSYTVIGNLAKNPMYVFMGKKDIDFGSFATVDMYAQPLTRTSFSALGNTMGMGVNTHGFNGTISFMNGGDNNSPFSNTHGLDTTNLNFASNNAVNLSYGMNTLGVNWTLGTGYLQGSTFANTSNGNNGAWDMNGKLSVAGFDLLTEFDTTLQATNHNMGNDTNRANAWSLGADYHFSAVGLLSVMSAEYSALSLAGGSNNQFGQFVVGYRILPVSNVWAGIEYAYNKNGSSATGLIYGSGYRSSTALLDVTAAF